MTTTFTRKIAAFGGMVVHSVRTARAYDGAGSDAARREVLDRYLAESTHFPEAAADRHLVTVGSRRVLARADRSFAA